MRHHVESAARGIEGVHLRDTGLGQVGDGTESVLVGLVDERCHDRGPLGRELETVDLRTVHIDSGSPTNPLAGLLGRVDGTLVPSLTGPRVREHARRDDLVAFGERLLLQRPHHRAVPDAA